MTTPIANVTMTTDELVAYYVDLLIMQYESLPNARATIDAYVRQAIGDQIIQAVEDGFDFSMVIGLQPDTAQGVQLTAVASYRGAARTTYGIDLNRQFFEMPFYGESGADTMPGFALYGESPITWFFLNYIDSNRPIYSLNDDELCRLTQLRAQVQSQLLSIGNVDTILFDFFADNVAVFEDGNLHITYIDLISDTDTLFGIAAQTQSLPRPAGVRLDILRSETFTEFFGFQKYNQSINPTFVGFGVYGTPKTGSFVRYP
jgi:hypothetical protein